MIFFRLDLSVKSGKDSLITSIATKHSRKLTLRKRKGAGSAISQRKCNRMRELILNLLATKGLFPPPNDIDEFLVKFHYFIHLYLVFE